jgi:hypothetical protein
LGLSLELGVPLHELGSMPERVLKLYHAYGEQRGFPIRRLELYMAQLTLVVAKTFGGAKNAKLTDFLLDPTRKPPEIDEVKMQLQFSPRKRKNGPR